MEVECIAQEHELLEKNRLEAAGFMREHMQAIKADSQPERTAPRFEGEITMEELLGYQDSRKC
jgi:hypothetical protein